MSICPAGVNASDKKRVVKPEVQTAEVEMKMESKKEMPPVDMHGIINNKLPQTMRRKKKPARRSDRRIG